ncbi:MAG: GntR family transcriptional regulator [Cypionkella sp.]|nr:GntR family transcriptional regulator [Cypionkella sp.]
MNVLNVADKQLKRRSLHLELAEAIRGLIMSGELPAGQKVPEKELCDTYGVSRTPLREALKVLATDGLLTLEPNRGAWVSQITEEDLEEVFPVMGALEALAGELACGKITDAEVEKVARLHDEMMDHYANRRLRDYFVTNQQIHETILEAARNQTLATQYRALTARVRRFRYIANMSDARWKRATEEHVLILDHLRNRDGKALSEVLRIHVQNKLDTVRDWLKQRDQDSA